jgi:hypothetical protein
VDVDDGLGNFSFHRDDPPSGQGIYGGANRLPVVLRLMAIGGSNPVCSRLPNLSGCTLSVTGIGITKASKILVRTLAVYTVNGTQWEDLADLAVQSAFDLYQVCRFGLCPDRVYSALPEQYTAGNAFEAIGYGPVNDPQTCYCP